MVVQGQGTAFAGPQRWGYGAYSGTGQRTRAPMWHHRGSSLKLQEGRVRRGLSARLGQQAGEDSLPWRVGGRVVPCRHPSAAPE